VLITHHFKRANWFLATVLRGMGFAGVTLPNRTIYLVPEHFADPVLRAHELHHIAQIDRDGWIFWPRCIWYVIRYGYQNSPYEIECRKVEDEVRKAITC
jgi:hypothetical protein